jgi:hypothetical protein
MEHIKKYVVASWDRGREAQSLQDILIGNTLSSFLPVHLPSPGCVACFILALFILHAFPQVLLQYILYQPTFLAPSSILSFHFSLLGRLQLLTPTVTF